MTPKATSTSAHRTSSGFGLMVPVSRSIVLKSAGQPRRTCLGVSAISRHTTQRADLLLLCFPLVGLRPTVAQRLSVRQVAAGQGRHGPAVPQLRRSRVYGVYGPEETETRARQAGAPQHDVLRRVGSFTADQTERRLEREVVTRRTAGTLETVDGLFCAGSCVIGPSGLPSAGTHRRRPLALQM